MTCIPSVAQYPGNEKPVAGSPLRERRKTPTGDDKHKQYCIPKKMKGDTVGDTVAEKVSRQFLAFSFQDSGLFKGYLCSKFQRCIESLNPVGP